ncbi:hypothetical protein NXW50_31035 [Bacteroides thetaiotaomicron]|nr:hypothetical protein [Bacteroides thetaiotaomicron]MCS2282401.1 hypothetical protein [Bacteroides thetaiotaomicron]
MDGNFIPPCTSMSSHPDLKGYYTKFGQLVDSIEKAPFDILAKVENAEKQTSLATNIGMLPPCHAVHIRYLLLLPQRGAILFTATLPECILHIGSPPVCMPEFHGQGRQDEDLLKYFNEWNGITPGAYEGLLRENSGCRTTITTISAN